MTLDILHADETELQVLREPGKKPQSKSDIWLSFNGWTAAHPTVLYEYQPDRKADHPIAFLKGYSGFLQTDGYQAYKMLVCVILVGCLGHGRRKFYRAIEALPKNLWKDCTAKIGLDYFDRLFQIEKKIFPDPEISLTGLGSVPRQKGLNQILLPFEIKIWRCLKNPGQVPVRVE